MSSPARSPSATVPFWERLQQILAYPLHSEALLTISLLAVLRIFGFIPGIAGWIVNLVVSAALFKYAAEVLSTTANGNMEAPNGYSTPDSLGWVILKVLTLILLILILIGIVLVVAGAPELIWIVAIAIALGTPAAMMSAAIDQDTFGALDPRMWWATITRIGWPYLGAALLCLLLMYSEANAKRLLLPFLPGPLAIIGHYFISHYATVVTFHLLGYLVYQYRDVLGYELKPIAIGTLPKPLDRDQSVLDHSEKLAADGDTQGAARALGEHLNERGGSDLMHQRYRKLLSLHGDTEGLNRHARQYLNVMIAQEKWRPALDFWSECRSGDPQLWPSDPDQVLELVDKAHEHGKPELSLTFANGFGKAYPKHTSVPTVHLRVARVLAGPMGNRGEARRLLEATVAAYPRSKAVPEIEAFLAQI